jgi:hypothetical protein
LGDWKRKSPISGDYGDEKDLSCELDSSQLGRQIKKKLENIKKDRKKFKDIERNSLLYIINI